MLQLLKIQNYAIIKQTEIRFEKGLNIITGETGAGKSILMGALGLILGERADTKVLLPGSEKLVVEGVFEVNNAELQYLLEENELDSEKQTILRREINSAGKSRAFINDTPINLPLLRSVGLLLIDIVSQHQTLELNEADFQMNVLDAFAESSKILEDYRIVFKQYKKSEQVYKDLLEREAKARSDEDYLRFVIHEISELNPKIGEETDLESEIQLLSHAEQIQTSCFQSSQVLEGNENSLLDQLREITGILAQSSKHQTALPLILDRLQSNIVDLSDIAEELSSIADKTLSDPELLAKQELRLQELMNMQKKHRVSGNEELLDLLAKFEARINEIGSLEEEIIVAEKQKSELFAKSLNLANELHLKRELALNPMKLRVLELLNDVAIPQAQFEVKLEKAADENLHSNGLNQLNFLFSANKGFPIKPLNEVASGGELSRLMLCLKSLISDKVELPSIVFDEIDTGISGEAALRVAQVMKAHATKHQVIAITHLPQIASKADNHFYVYKNHEEDQTLTQIRTLTEDERIHEIARMLSGENPGQAVLTAAKEMMSL
ncbi:MAG: DNA repair protein RecN [Bacteroidia bacterium]